MATNKKKYDIFKSEFYGLYENELGSDVILLVGEKGCQERIPAHTWVLATGSDFFRTLFHGPYAKSENKEYEFPKDDIIGFNNLIQWLYQNKCDLQSLQSSLSTLQTAIIYLCPDLAVKCVQQITKQLSVKNVIKVILNIQLYSNYSLPCDQVNSNTDAPNVVPPSAPAWEDQEDSSESSNLDPTVCCLPLFKECLEIIDKNVVQVMNCEDFVNADESLVRMVLRRPSLNVSSEMDIFRALHRWSTAVCKRQHFPLTLESRRKVLGSLLFQTRLLTIPLTELKASQDDLKLLLNEEELNYIICCVRVGSTSPTGDITIPSSIVEHLTLLSTPRNMEISEPNTKLESKKKKKSGSKKRFNKKEFVLDLVSVLALFFD